MDFRELDHEMADILKSDIGLLRVGMPPFRCSFALPAVLPEFHHLYPNVEIRITEDTSNSLDTALRSGQIDLAFYNISEPKTGLHYQLFAKDRLYAILPKGHPVAQKAFYADNSSVPQIRLEWLVDEVFPVQNRDQRQGQYILHELKEKHIVPEKILESSNIRAAALLAASGYGVAFLSGGLLRHFETTCEFDHYTLADCHYPINYVAAWREDSYLPAYALEFIRLMREKTCEEKEARI